MYIFLYALGIYQSGFTFIPSKQKKNINTKHDTEPKQPVERAGRKL